MTNKTVFDSTLLANPDQSTTEVWEAIMLLSSSEYSLATINVTAAFSLTSVGYEYHYNVMK